MKSIGSIITFILIFTSLLVDAKVQRQKSNHTSQSKKVKALKAKNASKAKQVSQAQLGVQLGTNYNFDDMAVRGKYQSAFEAQATVENEKPIDDLLDYRSNFRDRMAAAQEQR